MAINDQNTRIRPSKNKLNGFAAKTSPAEIRSGGSDSILAKMFRSIMWNTGMTETRWNHLMNNYIMDKDNCIPNNNKDQSSARGNLQKELLKKKMTWKVFCKGIRILNIIKFDFIIRAHHPNGKITEHLNTVSFGDILSEANDNTLDDNEVSK